MGHRTLSLKPRFAQKVAPLQENIRGTRQSMRNPFIDIDLALSAAARRRMASGADEDPAGDPPG
jgi:hypothetical protein